MRVVVLGGHGNFGARIARALAPHPRIDLVIAARDAARAGDFARSLGHGATARALDIRSPRFAEALAALRPDLVIHTAGPFQGQSHAVPLAVAAAGAHHLDLADGRRYVCDFVAATDAAFRRAGGRGSGSGPGRAGITGASTLPALSSAAVDALAAGWRAVDAIDIAIAPAQTAPRGEATLAGVLASCGQPVAVWRDGGWHDEPGWAAPRAVRIDGLKPRLGALCDVPDLALFPARHPGVRTVMFRAALEVALAQRGFAALAGLRRLGLLKKPETLAPALLRIGTWLDPLGSALGGMVVRVQGRDADDRFAARSWHVLAPDDHGPEIPCMPAILLTRRLAEGGSWPVGAQVCMGLLGLDDFAPEFARWGMTTVIRDDALSQARR